MSAPAGASAAAPVVSLCIPTFERARYLRGLLPTLVEGLAGFPFAAEVVVSDNASTDETPAVLREFESQLPLRVFRHAENRGAYANVGFALSQGAGTFLVYLADDDRLDFGALAALLTRLLASPRTVTAYAPWRIHDLVDDRAQGTFYAQPEDVLVARGDQRTLLDHVLRHGAFPEISVVRRAAWHALRPRPSDLAYWAFVHASDYLGLGDVLLASEPFYVSISRHFEGPARVQAGLEEVEVAWDRYRGGLEYMIARATPPPSESERAALLARIDVVVAQRIAVAIRVRLARNRDAVDTWMLACRLRGLGQEALLPVPLGVLAARAALWFVAHGEGDPPGAAQVVCDASIRPDFRGYLASIAAARVRHGVPDDALTDGVLFAATDADVEPARRARLTERGVRVVSLARTLARFPA